MSNTTTATPDPQYVGWMPAPTRRGTINIIWLCLSVLLICSYKCIHLNISDDDEIHADWYRLKGMPLWPEWPMIRRSLRKLKWMVVTIIAPEVGVFLAADQFFAAQNSLGEITRPDRFLNDSMADAANNFNSWIADKRERNRVNRGLPAGRGGRKTQNELTMAHAFYANMGGFAMAPLADGDRRAWHEEWPEVERDDDGWHAGWHGFGRKAQQDDGHLTLIGYVSFLQRCAPGERRDLFARSHAEIRALGKSDTLTKTLAILQSLYLAVDCVGRAANNLPISLLELSTAAYVVAAVIMYGLWWDKPYDAEVTTMLVAESGWPRGNESQEQTRDGEQRPLPQTQQAYELKTPLRRSRRSKNRFKFRHWSWNIASGTATVFGAIHIIAWNWRFVNDTTRMIWRVSSIITTAVPVVILLLQYIDEYSDDLPAFTYLSKYHLSSDRLPFYVLALAYVGARGCIIGITFYSLSYLPAGTYDTVSWTNYLPFIG